MSSDLKDKTIRDFGEQWLAFRDNPAYYGSVELLADIFGPLIDVATIKGARVAEIGSGTGRIVNMLLDAGAAHVTAVEPSQALLVLKENTASRNDRVEYINAPGEALPPRLGLDLVVSIGVLHHIPDPAPVVRAAYQSLRPGGKMLVWLYGREGNASYLRVVEPLRKITVRMPHWALEGLSVGLTFALSSYIGACRFLPLPMRPYMRGVLANFPFSVRKLTIYDQLNPAYAKYYTRDEAIGLLSDAGFQDVTAFHRHGYSWTVAGAKEA